MLFILATAASCCQCQQQGAPGHPAGRYRPHEFWLRLAGARRSGPTSRNAQCPLRNLQSGGLEFRCGSGPAVRSPPRERPQSVLSRPFTGVGETAAAGRTAFLNDCYRRSFRAASNQGSEGHTIRKARSPSAGGHNDAGWRRSCPATPRKGASDSESERRRSSRAGRSSRPPDGVAWSTWLLPRHAKPFRSAIILQRLPRHRQRPRPSLFCVSITPKPCERRPFRYLLLLRVPRTLQVTAMPSQIWSWS